jgi:hypothetical protein
MTKNQTIDLLKSQLPGFYSVEQVINLIEKIEDDSSRKITTDDISRAIENTVRWMEREQSEFLDINRAEFELNYDNRIELVGVPIDIDNITEALENNFMDFGEVEEKGAEQLDNE